MFLHGGHALVLEPGKGSWALETELGAVMDGTTVEHIIEAARVLGRYADALAVRSLSEGTDWAVEREDRPSATSRATARSRSSISSRRAGTPARGWPMRSPQREARRNASGKRFVLSGPGTPRRSDGGAGQRGDRRGPSRDGDRDRRARQGYDLDPEDYAAIETLATAARRLDAR